MKKLTAVITLLVLCFVANAQTASIKGIVTDTINKQTLGNTVVSLLSTKDSVLQKFVRTNNNGGFELKNLPAGKFVLMITYPGYADYFDNLELEEGKTKELGKVMMTLKSRILEEVFVKQKIAAIRIKGDTIEYKADSFKVSAGASVEEMLRKLPGLQVDKDGNITAQGEKIEKVLVDGEEFFGDDPTMATKNLQADAIDKVQVFDKKSDQAAFTGIDDGSKSKTLNLTMKEDRKRGYFGKVDLAAGPSNRWNNTLMGNAFKGKRKLSAYGIMSSTGKTGLDWDEQEKFGSGSNLEYNEDIGGVIFTGGDDFEGGSFYGEGVPKSWSTGINYSNKFNRDRTSVNGSYRYNKLNNEGGGSTISRSLLPDSLFFNTNENRNSYNSRQRHSANGTYEWSIDSSSSIKVTAKGFTGTQLSISTFNSEAINNAGRLANRNRRLNSSDGINDNFNSSFIYRKKFKKVGRTLSITFDQQYKNNNTTGNLYSENEYYSKIGGLIKIDTIDQKKINQNLTNAFNSRLAFTERLIKNLFLEINYGIRINNSESRRLSYDRGIGGKYESLNAEFSNDYDFNILTNSTGSMLRYNGKKTNASAGGDIAKSNFTQTNLLNKSVSKYSFTNFFPRANYAYKFNPNSRISLNYNGNTRQPTIEQIQPVRDNNNPLNIAIGNPDLKQEFRHSLNLNFNTYKVLKQRGAYFYSNFSAVSNAITTSDVTDTVGRRFFQYININGNFNSSGGGSYNLKLSKLNLNVSMGGNFNLSHYNNFVNIIRNETRNYSYGANIQFYKYKEDKFDISWRSSINNNVSTSSIRKDQQTKYYTHDHNLFLNLTIKKKFVINSEVVGNFREKTELFNANNNIVLWNGYIGRKILKNDKGMIRLQGYDILNQNRGYRRFINSNILRENNYQTLSRYFMLTFVYNFSKTPGGMVAPK